MLLVAGIALFSAGDAQGLPNFSWAGIALISLALVCDAMTANLEEKQFFRIRCRGLCEQRCLAGLTCCDACSSWPTV